MKVALVAEWLDPWRGGAETSTRQFIHHLIGKGVELHVFTRSCLSPNPGMHLHVIGGASLSRTRASMTFARRVEHLLAKESFDLIHAVSLCRFADIYQPRGGTVAETIERNLALRASGTARSLKRCANHFNFKQRHRLALERELLGQQNGLIVVAISNYVASQLSRHYGLSKERIRLIYNGVDVPVVTAAEAARERAALRREFGIGESDCLVILVAHNFRLKGVRHWIEAMALLLRRGVGNVRSIIAGKGDAPRWRRLAGRLGVSKHLAFIGPTDRVQALRHAADVLVHPTYYDPCSRVVLEGMVAGLPCVTTRWDGAAEMITDGRNGYVLDEPRDVVALADHVGRLRDPALRRSLGEAARGVAGRVSMARNASEMMRLYETVATVKVE